MVSWSLVEVTNRGSVSLPCVGFFRELGRVHLDAMGPESKLHPSSLNQPELLRKFALSF